MKTPEEIKKGLEVEISVHYHLPNPEPRLTPRDFMYMEQLHSDALTYINQLEQRLAQAERERDALRQCTCGDTVYKLITTKDGGGSIVEEQLCGFHYINPPKQRSNKRGSYMIAYHESSGHISHLPVSQIGKTIFSAYEDAKKALDERRGVCEENTNEDEHGNQAD